MKEKLTESHKYRVWQRNLLRNGLTIHGVEELYTKHRHNGEVLFSLVNLDASLPEGGKILPLCMIKGEVVTVLVCFIEKETKERFLLLVKQRRICDGSMLYEHPAGMVDKDDKPLAVAVKEVKEETGLMVTEEQIIALNQEPLYPSTGTCDEAMYFFCCELEMSHSEMDAYHDKIMGVEHENESIITEIVPLKDALRLITNTNGLLNIYMYLQYKGEIRI
ncbi:MAG: NUDIX hydrolase [Bacteroidia bacterium]|nr:NUDIX hydrolase [Bacteroidia bacterium]